MSRSAAGLKLDWVRGVEAGSAPWNRIVGWLAAAVIALAAVVGFVEYRRIALENEMADLRAETEARRKAAAAEAARLQRDPATAKALRDHNQVVVVLTAIERVSVEGVQIDEVTLRPEVPDFRVDARAATAAHAQKYVGALNDSDREGDWVIIQMKSLVREPGFSFSAISTRRQGRDSPAAAPASK